MCCVFKLLDKDFETRDIIKSFSLITPKFPFYIFVLSHIRMHYLYEKYFNSSSFQVFVHIYFVWRRVGDRKYSWFPLALIVVTCIIFKIYILWFRIFFPLRNHLRTKWINCCLLWLRPSQHDTVHAIVIQ